MMKLTIVLLFFSCAAFADAFYPYPLMGDKGEPIYDHKDHCIAYTPQIPAKPNAKIPTFLLMQMLTKYNDVTEAGLKEVNKVLQENNLCGNCRLGAKLGSSWQVRCPCQGISTEVNITRSPSGEFEIGEGLRIRVVGGQCFLTRNDLRAINFDACEKLNQKIYGNKKALQVFRNNRQYCNSDKMLVKAEDFSCRNKDCSDLASGITADYFSDQWPEYSNGCDIPGMHPLAKDVLLYYLDKCENDRAINRLVQKFPFRVEIQSSPKIPSTTQSNQ